MEKTYRIILSHEQSGYTVFVPDFESGTQGTDLADAMYMARDLIGIMGTTLQDIGKDIPAPGTAEYVPKNNEIVTYVNVDFREYRRKNNNKEESR